MSQPRVLILRAPGTNCDQETSYAFQRAGGRADIVHINRLRENPELSAQYQILCIPGGFSYGDDIAAGQIVAGQLRHHLDETLLAFRDAGKLILGICNGFQILLKSGLLLSQADSAPKATLTWNDSGKFENRWVHLRVAGDHCVFLRGVETLYLPVAHAEGKFVARDTDTLEQLRRDGQLVLRYSQDSPNGQHDSNDWRSVLQFPVNPNGSEANVAGVCDETGRVFGLMPHPERFIEPTHHPSWTRIPDLSDEHLGLRLFRSAVEYFSA